VKWVYSITGEFALITLSMMNAPFVLGDEGKCVLRI